MSARTFPAWPLDRPALNSVAGDRYRESQTPGSGVFGFEAIPLEDPARAAKGDLGMKGKPPPRSSFEYGGDQHPFKNLKGGR